MADENLSGVPPSVTLSGLNAGEPNIGGTAQPGLSGAPGQGGAGGLIPGMEGGLDLATLLQMLQAGDTSGIGSAGGMNQSLAAGSFGQQLGGLGAQSFGQTQPGYVAGQSSAGGNPALQAAAGSIDPASIIQKFLGVAAQGSRAVQNAMTASPSAGSDLTLNTSLGGESGAGSPGIGTASPTIAQDQQGALGSSFLNDPTLSGLSNLFTTGKLNGWDGSPESLNTLMASDPSIRDALMQGNVGGSLGEELGAGSGGAGGFTLGTGGSVPGGTPDVLGGGLGLLNGLMSLYQGGKSGNVGSLLGGAGSTLSGANQIFSGMGLGEAGESLGQMGGLVNAPFAVFNLINSIDQGDPVGITTGLAALYGTTVPVINSLFGSSLPSLTSLAAQAITAIAPEVAAQLGVTIGTSIAPTLGGSLGPQAMLMGPYIVAKLMQLGQAMGPDKANARQLGIRVKNISSQLPGELAQLQSIPQITSGLTPDSTPDQAAGILKQLNDIQQAYQAGGWEDYQKAGGTSVESVGEGNMQVDLPEVQTALDRMSPYLMQLNMSRLRAEDMLTNAGWSPEQIQEKTGKYLSPTDFALLANSQSLPHGGETMFPGFTGTLNSALRPASLQGGTARPGTPTYEMGDIRARIASGALNGGDQATLSPQEMQSIGLPADAKVTWQDLGNYFGQGGAGAEGQISYDPTGLGTTSNAIQQQLSGLKLGGLEQQLAQFLQPYGGVNPMWQQLGFGQFGQNVQNGQSAVPPQIMAAANSPQASTAGAMGANGAYNADGRLTEETLMDILRRMSPGAAYAGV